MVNLLFGRGVTAVAVLLLAVNLRSFAPVSSFQSLAPTQSFSRKPSTTTLFVSRSSPPPSFKTADKGNNNAGRVVYQKVVKSPTDVYGNGNPVFLGYLVEYLQEHFELPDRLPMVYESVPLDDNDADKSICSWDSPMSQSPETTRLDMEVVAIYTDEEEELQRQQTVTVPSMAMVVVRKAPLNPQNNKASPMMQNLFDDSEKRILRAIDRGLDDFMAGKIPLEGMTAGDKQSTPKSPVQELLDKKKSKTSKDRLQTAQDAMIEELLEDDAANDDQDDNDEDDDDDDHNGNNVVDADFSRVEEEEVPTPKAEIAPDLDASQDFAIQAAAKLAAQRIQQEETSSAAQRINEEVEFGSNKGEKPVVDFAVAAAEKIAREQEGENEKKSKTTKKSSKKTTAATAAAKPTTIMEAPVTVENTAPLPDLVANGGGHDRAFHTSFSTPDSYAKKVKKEGQPKQQKSTIKGKDAKAKTAKKVITEGNSSPLDTKQVAPKASSNNKKERKLNLKVVDEEGNESDPPTEKKGKNIIDSKALVTDDKDKKNVPSDEDVLKTAQDVMTELADQGADMSPEQLLEDVLKFGEKQEQENADGSGFVSGAFEKAKELLREQKQQREVRMADSLELESKTVDSNANQKANGPQFKEREDSSEEDELRKMFEAGEKLADGRITIASNSGSMASPMTNKDEEVVDELIAGDKTVSSHARVLDDELAELEIRIKKTPGEDNDGPSFEKNPLFDVFSGPEVYNPNVDPEDAVNWPGAKPGTSTNAVENKLPKELSEAIKYAKFASELLQNMETRGDDNEKKTYHVGKRKMSKEQIDNLQTVVNESVELGIIPDPLVMMEERARLQMVLDELQSQPEERFREILTSYKELLLSDNFVDLIKERLSAMADRDMDALRKRSDDDDNDVELEKAHAREREILGQLVVNAQLLLKEARALGAELEAQQIEVIRSICKVAMDPSHVTEEEAAAALTDAVRDMKPLFDEMFVAYLKYAVAEEEGRLARAGVLDDPEHNQWLFVLKIVQQGVYAEISKGINRYIEHLWYILRMETATERKMLLSKLIDVMPTLDVRPFVRVVDNIVGSLGEAAKGEFDGGYELGKMTNKLLQLHRDMKELLPTDRIDRMSRDADEWAAKQKERMLEQRNLTKKRLKAARETESYDEEIEAIGKFGEMERFD